MVLLVVGAVVSTEAGPGARDAASQAAQAQRVVDGAIAREPGTPHATLRSGDGQPMAVVLAEPTGPRVVPVAMTDPGQGHRYLLWAATAGAAAVPVAAVDPATGTTTALPGAAPPSPRAFALSVEPDGPPPARPSAVVGVGVVAT